MKRRSSYKVTFFDRHGPEGALLLKALGTALMPAGLGGIMLTVLGSQMLHLGGARLILFTLIGTLSLFAGAVWFSLRMGSAAGEVASKVYMGGDTTPYEDQFSEEQARVMQRDYATALAMFEHRITMNPNDPRVLMATADLYATHGENPKRAAELYRQVQKLPEVGSGQDVYVSNKLADLYLGPLKEPKRALVEFRRLMERYPGSVAASHAKLALENLKTDLMSS